MLESLHVKNMALIKEVEVEFGKGLNIMTGETGAGKSIVIGSVNIALGTGNFKDYVPEDADYALVELVFSSKSRRVRELMEAQDIPFDNDEIILTRKYKGGRSTSKLNGETVPVSFVRELAGELIDIHGQHEHQSLLYSKNHLRILDEFAGAGIKPLLTECQEAYHAYQKAKRAFQKASSDSSDRVKERDFLEFEIHEIESASLKPGEDEILETEYRRMANGQKIMESLQEAGNLTGASGYSGAADEIGRAVRAMNAVRGFDENLEDLCTTLVDMESLLNDFNRGLSDYMDDFSFDEKELNDTQERLDLINHLKSKYGSTIEHILKELDQKMERLDVLDHYEEHLGMLKQEYEKAEKRLYSVAEKISGIRQKSSGILADKIQKALVDLNFLDVRFEVRVSMLEHPEENGMNEVNFLISTNPGLPVKPLGSVASGGELSRIMLAIKAVMADKDEVETLIFDEIDTGISGRTAQKVSEKMAVISDGHQVICITHLAQIAAMADHHYIIEKKPADSKTVTNLAKLSEEDSILELARILGGAEITETVIQSAREMKQLANQMKAIS